jgi:hypothetical protein
MAAVAGVSAVAFAVSVQAHHSNGMFDLSTAIWVKGTVVRYEPVSPHAMIELEERTPPTEGSNDGASRGRLPADFRGFSISERWAPNSTS